MKISMKNKVGSRKALVVEFRDAPCQIPKTEFRKQNPKSQISRRGAALVVTLAILVLVTVLVLSLFLSVTSERTESAAAVNQDDAQRLAAGVVELVKSTITQATTGYQSDASTGAPILSSPVAWASQPGLIRTWDTSGNPYRSYRLYSSGNITVTAQGDLVNDAAELANWKSGAPANAGSYNARWCDLNAPATDSSGRRNYPIVTPPGDANSGSTAMEDSVNGIPTDNPSSATQEGVQGFSIKNPPGYSSGTASATNNPAPMPVKWLYVLANGNLLSPSGNGTFVTIDGGTPETTPSQSNPIVGRVAYWTDDETCKVNINTASEGSFWQYPRSFGGQYPAQTSPGFTATALAQYQPSRNEFQRYPGHPAMTSLSAVLNNLSPDEIFSLVPRVQPGGSLGGSRSPFNQSISLSGDLGRLYASPDELLYTPDRTINLPLTSADVKKRGFFLTANSRAPETTLFETPRISIWPATLPLANKQDSFDKLLAFCATMRPQGVESPYFFQRQDPRSPTSDWSNIPRNRSIYAYLQRMTGTSNPIPGFGGSFETKYGADRDQILTEIFDYIRSGPNLMGAGHAITSGNSFLANSYAFTDFFKQSSAVVPIQIGTTRGFGNSWFIQQAGIGFFCEGMELVPSTGGVDSKIRYTVRAAPLIQLYRPSFMWDAMCLGPIEKSSTPGVSGLWMRIKDQSPATLTASGNGTTVSGSSINFPINDPLVLGRQAEQVPVSPVVGFGTFGLPYPKGVVQDTLSGKLFASSGQATFEFNTPVDPLTGIPFTIDPNSWDPANMPNRTALFDTSLDPNLRMTFSGVTMTLEILSYDRATVLQTVRVDIPGGTFAVPHWNFNSVPAWSSTVSNALQSQSKFSSIKVNFAERASSAVGFDLANMGFVGMDGDVVIGTEIKGSDRLRGDGRLAAIRGLDAQDLQVPGPSLRLPLKHAHAFALCPGSNLANPLMGTAVRDVPASSTWSSRFLGSTTETPAVSSTVNGILKADGYPGDWDNGFGNNADGPYINAPDQGAIGQGLGGNIGPDALAYFTTLPTANQSQNADQFVSLYSPNRQMYSAFQFGSLPSRASGGDPWETLLFCPNPASTRANHRGYTETPKDYLLADLFWMPIVDPYPISEPFSTAGKINLNYAIAPFGGYLERKTPLLALLKASRITAFDTTLWDGRAAYKMKRPLTGSIVTQNVTYVRDIDIAETLKGTDTRFTANDIFKSPAEIAEIFLVPQGCFQSNVESWWASQKFTGDNTREQPYAYLLPRLTTKSNTFTVHYRVQALKQITNTHATAADWKNWDEARDQVVSEFRGSSTIERYVDPNDTSIPDFVQATDTNSNGTPDNKENLSPYYRWRIVSKRQFVP